MLKIEMGIYGNGYRDMTMSSAVFEMSKKIGGIPVEIDLQVDSPWIDGGMVDIQSIRMMLNKISGRHGYKFSTRVIDGRLFACRV